MKGNRESTESGVNGESRRRTESPQVEEMGEEELRSSGVEV